MKLDIAEIAGRQIALEATVFALLARIASHADNPPTFLIEVLGDAERNVRNAAKDEGKTTEKQAAYAVAAFDNFTASALALLNRISPAQGRG